MRKKKVFACHYKPDVKYQSITVGRFINALMKDGKKSVAERILYGAFDIIEEKSKEKPLEVFEKALENAAPREEITTIEYGGARYPQAVDSAPQRRVDIALSFFTQGASQKSFNTKKSIEECLADEIVNAYNLSQNSLAISKKLELERQADASR